MLQLGPIPASAPDSPGWIRWKKLGGGEEEGEEEEEESPKELESEEEESPKEFAVKKSRFEVKLNRKKGGSRIGSFTFYEEPVAETLRLPW